MIDIDGLKIDRDKYGYIIVTLPDGGTLKDQSVQTILLYEILSTLKEPRRRAMFTIPELAITQNKAFYGIPIPKKGKRGPKKA